MPVVDRGLRGRRDCRAPTNAHTPLITLKLRGRRPRYKSRCPTSQSRRLSQRCLRTTRDASRCRATGSLLQRHSTLGRSNTTLKPLVTARGCRLEAAAGLVRHAQCAAPAPRNAVPDRGTAPLAEGGNWTTFHGSRDANHTCPRPALPQLGRQFAPTPRHARESQVPDDAWRPGLGRPVAVQHYWKPGRNVQSSSACTSRCQPDFVQCRTPLRNEGVDQNPALSGTFCAIPVLQTTVSALSLSYSNAHIEANPIPENQYPMPVKE